MKIGFFDSGIGGMTVLHQALKILPNEDYIFYADTKNVPYGEKPKEEVEGYINEAAEFMERQGVKALVIACNTATSIAVDELRKKYSFPILGIEPAVKPAVANCQVKNKKVLVMATRLTLQETKYHNLVERLNGADLVESVPMPGLVELAEKFEFEPMKVKQYLLQELEGLELNEYGTVVLGCTHFPYFKNIIADVFPEGVDIISGSVGTAKNLKRILEDKKMVGGGTGEIEFYKSGEKITNSSEVAKYIELFGVLEK